MHVKFWLSSITYVAAVFFIFHSCGSDDSDETSKFKLTFQGKEYSPHLEQNLKIAVLSRTEKKVVKTAEMTLQNQDFSFEWPGILTEGHDYYVDFFADLNQNGSCDSPMTDHTWRIKVNQVSGDLSLSDTHNMNFTDICRSFSDTPFQEGSGTQVTLKGKLSLSNDVAGIEGLAAGQKLQGASVFVENYPESEAISDQDGNFELTFNTNALTLTEDPYHLVMWYTKKSAGSTEVWDTDALRVGARKSFEFVATDNKASVDVSDVSLTYTARAKIRLRDRDSGAGISTCWIEIPAYRFQLFFVDKGDGYFNIDYLPEGSYTIRPHCTGYKDSEHTLAVPAASGLGELRDLGNIDLEK